MSKFYAWLKLLPQHLALGGLFCYRNLISPLKPPCCRFQPTCSAYAREAILRFGIGRGTWLSLRRLLRCHPFHHGPLFDPVPPLQSRSTEFPHG